MKTLLTVLMCLIPVALMAQGSNDWGTFDASYWGSAGTNTASQLDAIYNGIRDLEFVAGLMLGVISGVAVMLAWPFKV